MAKTILGVFSEREHVEEVIEELKAEGFNPRHISIVMRDARDAQTISDTTGTTVAEGAVSGATTGALLGGLAGLVAAIAIPGLGAFFIGGPLATALGLTGAAASTVSGAATGAVAGGLFGALTNLGLSEEEARYYEGRVKEGAILIAVPAQDNEEVFVRDIFDEFNAADVRAVSSTEDDYVDERAERDETYTARGALGGKSEHKPRVRRRRV